MASRGVNKVILIGNAGRDPETRYMPSGSPVCNLPVATSEVWKDKNTGQQQERTEWHRVVFFNRLAEIVNEYIRKGSRLYIEGSLRTRSWEQDGVTRYSTEIIAGEMQMLDSRAGGQGGDSREAPSWGQSDQQGGGQAVASGNQQGKNSRSGSGAPADGGFNDEFDDDIPF